MRISMSAIAIDVVLSGYSAQCASVGVDVSLVVSAATIGDDRGGYAVVAAIAAGRVGTSVHAL